MLLLSVRDRNLRLRFAQAKIMDVFKSDEPGFL